jgi:hypothetical protein
MAAMPTPPPPPLAYVFWHRARAGAAGPAYQADLLNFHASLAAAPPPGFIRSGSVRLAAASWLIGSGEAFEDWYLVRDWTAIGVLNRAAVAAAHLASHDRVAHQAGAGTGAIYRLRAGDDNASHSIGTWFAKPAGVSYADLDAALAPAVSEGSALWERELVLGPAPEFCLRSRTTPTLAVGIDGERVDYRRLA